MFDLPQKAHQVYRICGRIGSQALNNIHITVIWFAFCVLKATTFVSLRRDILLLHSKL